MLLKFQKKNLLESETSSSDSDVNKYDLSKTMDNSNYKVKRITYERLKHNVKQFHNKDLSEIDKKVIRGIYLRNLKEFQDDLYADMITKLKRFNTRREWSNSQKRLKSLNSQHNSISSYEDSD